MNVEVERRNQGQWFVRYKDSRQAIDGQTEPAVLHTSHWTGGRLYFDPNAHPTSGHTNAGKYTRKLRDIVDYVGEFRVIEAKIAANGSHALILEPTGRHVVMAR